MILAAAYARRTLLLLKFVAFAVSDAQRLLLTIALGPAIARLGPFRGFINKMAVVWVRDKKITSSVYIRWFVKD